MNLDWQTIAVLTIVAGAAVYLAHAAWQTVARRRAAACASGCSSCPARDNEPAVVGIEPLVLEATLENSPSTSGDAVRSP